jgi:hypothetical protein
MPKCNLLCNSLWTEFSVATVITLYFNSSTCYINIKGYIKGYFTLFFWVC